MVLNLLPSSPALLPGGRREQIGFTLVELLLSLSLLGMILLLALPTFQTFYQKNLIQQRGAEIAKAINFARNIALNSRQSVTLIPLGREQDWSYGMALLAMDKTVIHEWRWARRGLTVKWRGFQSPYHLIFSSHLRHSSINGYFLVSGQGLAQKWVVNRLGRVRASEA